jgi:hypothetical protein
VSCKGGKVVGLRPHECQQERRVLSLRDLAAKSRQWGPGNRQNREQEEGQKQPQTFPSWTSFSVAHQTKRCPCGGQESEKETQQGGAAHLDDQKSWSPDRRGGWLLDAHGIIPSTIQYQAQFHLLESLFLFLFKGGVVCLSLLAIDLTGRKGRQGERERGE